MELPELAQLWDTTLAPTLVAHGPEFQDRPLPSGPQRVLLSASEPEPLMQELTHRGCNRVLWECGPELAAAAIRQGCIQDVAVVVAPKLMGGVPARTPLGDLGFTAMDQVVAGSFLSPVPLGDDWLFQFKLNP
jgi:diaminohydroxyphosphoribosylaminopyrimidine deaminase/5-amino-6-(5-phosphoribosylamino)uracil reductase